MPDALSNESADGDPRVASPAGLSLRRLAWILVAVAFVGYQLALLRTTAAREVAWAYPAMWDQSYYLSNSYRLHDLLLTQGIRRFMAEALQPTPQGFLLPLQATAAFLVAGATRLTALSLNFSYFIAFESAIVGVLWSRRRSWSFALIGLGLVLCLSSPFL